MSSRFKKSLDMLDKALEVIPKGTQTASKCHDQWATGTAPIFCKSADGCYITDIDGNTFVDHMMALGPIILGYNYPRTNAAVMAQLEDGMLFSLSSPLEIELAELIREIVPCGEMVRFGKNGSDVTSIAVRVARSYSGKELLLSPEGHYHGWADFAAASGTRNGGLPKCMHNLVHKFKYNDLPSLEVYLKTGDYAAVIMEPVALIDPKPGYLQGVRDLCDKYDTILIFDELITGFRWALGGAQQHYGVTADLATYGKAISNGMPLAVLCGKTKYMMELDEVFFSGTYLGDLLSIAAAIETIKELKEGADHIYPYIWNQGRRMSEAFNSYANEIGINAEMYGPGPRHNIKFSVDDAKGAKDLFHKEMISRDIFIGTQIYICMSHTEELIGETIKAMKQSLLSVKCALDSNTIDGALGGNRSADIFKQSTMIEKE